MLFRVGLSMQQLAVLLFYINKIGLSSVAAVLLKFFEVIGLLAWLSHYTQVEVYVILLEKGEGNLSLRMGQSMEHGMMWEAVGQLGQKQSCLICHPQPQHWSSEIGCTYVDQL